MVNPFKGALYRIWCGVNRLGDSGVNRLSDSSAFVIPAGQLLLTWRGKTRMYTVGIVFEFYTVKGALYRIQILCRRYTFWSYPAGLTNSIQRPFEGRCIEFGVV